MGDMGYVVDAQEMTDGGRLLPATPDCNLSNIWSCFSSRRVSIALINSSRCGFSLMPMAASRSSDMRTSVLPRTMCFSISGSYWANGAPRLRNQLPTSAVRQSGTVANATEKKVGINRWVNKWRKGERQRNKGTEKAKKTEEWKRDGGLDR